MIETIKFIGAVIASLLAFAVAIFYLLPVLFMGLRVAFFDLKKSIYESKIARKNWEEVWQSVDKNSALHAAKRDVVELKKKLNAQTDELTAYRENVPKIEKENNDLTMQNRELIQQEKDRSELLDRIVQKNLEFQIEIDALRAENKNLHNENEQLNKKISSSKKAKKTKTLFWSTEQKEFYKSDRLKAVFDEQIQERFSSPIKEDEPPHFAFVTIKPSNKVITKAIQKGKETPSHYETTLRYCTCRDFNKNLKRKAPCKHILALALCVGIISPTGEFINTNPKIPESKNT